MGLRHRSAHPTSIINSCFGIQGRVHLGRPLGALLVVHRSCMCERGMTRGVVMEDAPFGVDLNIVIGFVKSQNEQGMFKI